MSGSRGSRRPACRTVAGRGVRCPGRVLLCFAMFYYVLLCFCYVLLCFAIFYYVLLCLLRFRYVLLCGGRCLGTLWRYVERMLFGTKLEILTPKTSNASKVFLRFF